MYSWCTMSTLKMIYFAYFLSTMEYDILFWDNSIGSKQVFLQQRRICRILTVSSSRTSCKPYFRDKDYLHCLGNTYLPLVRFLSQNLEIYAFNAKILGFNTRNKLVLHKPSTTLAIYQKGAYTDGIKIFNKLVKYIAKSVLKEKNVL